jgi:flagellar protein FliS
MYSWLDEEDILRREPLELVSLLYAKALEKIGLARTLTGGGQLRERNQAIARASEVLIELQVSLDADKGGDISRNLERIYEYVQRRLAEGLAQRTDEPLAEAAALLETLADGWREACVALAPPVQQAPREEELELAGAGRAWTL